MNKILAVLLIVCLFGSIGIATAAKPPQVPPETPSLLEFVNELKATVAVLQTSVSDLWGNATQQQTAIENEATARTGDIQTLWANATEQQSAIDNEEIARDTSDQALWANATEQQSAIDNEEIARDTSDQALWANATEQQTAIDAIQSGSATQFGDWTDVNLDMESEQELGDPFVFNVLYIANTDGFIVVMGDSTSGFTHSDYEVIYDKDDASWKVYGKYGFTMPVKAGDYWEVTSPEDYGNIWWIPLISTT
jgi:hypothetical protein